MINQFAKIKGIYSVLKHVPEHLHKVANRMGEVMSREKCLSVLDSVSADFDQPAKNAKAAVESLYLGNGNFGPRARKVKAKKEGIMGFGYFPSK